MSHTPRINDGADGKQTYDTLGTTSPNFKGAAEAAERLATIPEFQNARVVKSNPDTPQSMVGRWFVST